MVRLFHCGPPCPWLVNNDLPNAKGFGSFEERWVTKRSNAFVLVIDECRVLAKEILAFQLSNSSELNSLLQGVEEKFTRRPPTTIRRIPAEEGEVTSS